VASLDGVRVSLFRRVFAINVGVLVAASLALALSPVTVSAPVRLAEALVLAAGLAVLIALNVVLLRGTFRPLERLAALMRRVDPMAPGERIPLDGATAEVVDLGRAFNEMLDRLESERRDSGARALAAMEDERLRIARELHDEVGQTITAMVLQLETFARQAPEPLQSRLEELRETARGSVEEVRDIAHRLRPEALDDFGLRTALATLASTFADRVGLRVRARVTPELPALSREHELAIYRVAQESLTNVARHAGASLVELDLERSNGALVLEVRDDGAGLNGTIQADGAGGGIRGMRERALLVGGRLDLGRGDPRGTVVRLTVPLRDA
jgi:two-component system sensor histidine kinase UhpB